MHGALYPMRQAVALTELPRDRRPRLNPDGSPVPGKAGRYEEGLSCTYADSASAEQASLAAKHQLDRFRVIGLRVADVLTLKLRARWDPVYTSSDQYDPHLGEVVSHSLIIASGEVTLLSAPIRQALIERAWVVDVNTGALVALYRDRKPPFG